MLLFYLPTYLISPMKNLFSSFSSLLVAAACALTLGSCNRAEYAMLPQGASYLGSTRVATPAPAPKPAVAPTEVAAAPTEAAVAAPKPAVAAAPAEATPSTSNVAEVSSPAATIPAATAAAPAALGSTAAISTPTAPAKMTRVQRFAASKAIKMMSKASGVTQFKEKLDVAKTQKVSGNLRTGIILILIGLIISLFSRVNSIFGLIGAIIAIIGLIFIVLWLLDNI
ncbi:hypothetical protein Q5H93_19295 [Hymenobacter sp. ASUV-10]|uniref:DUF2339 domain-containing protein n=1 Tax=Hymenobacter aranciens TaxID=3063996 RepID=A0ABT9BF66_9BACT|nr:hypothetical protein [Hymenobacter sp. ASUV-10]MDO7876900.1 hypothetical protein [Hymenobacter sp. ASUV-10]